MSKFILNSKNMTSQPQQMDPLSSNEVPVPQPVELTPGTDILVDDLPVEEQPKGVKGKLARKLTLAGDRVKIATEKVQLWFNHVTKPRPLRQSYLFWFGVAMGVSSSTIAVGAVWYNLEKSLPDSVDGLVTYARPGTLTIKAADGTILQQVGDVTHDYLKIWEIPDVLTQAFVASEDHRFYEHNGVDLQGIMRAAFANMLAGEVKEGGSTITQQLTRITFLTQERKLWRKLREVRLARQIDQEYSKDLILERYLNLVYLGSESYGVGDAAWTYFGKSAEELTLPEAAMIAGLTPAPSLYSPFTNPELAKTRRDTVIRRMEEEGFISATEAKAAINSPLATNRKIPKRFARIAPHFTDYIRQELPQYVDKKLIEAGGLTVETTLNPQWQGAAEKAVEKSLSTYGRYQRYKQASLVSVDPRNGQIKAMVGGRDYYDLEAKGYFNRAVQAQRQPGSTFKAFVYATAIASGFSPYTSYRDAQYIVDGYKPKNFGGKYRNAMVSIRDAITSSINVVALRTMMSVGWNPTIEVAQKMGIDSNLNPTYSLALGAYEVNLLEITNAYGTLANKGLNVPAFGISRVFDREGDLIYEADFEPTRGLDEDSAAIMTWMLQNVVRNGTGGPAQIGRPVAGKTGTSDDARDLWFIGYIPQVVTGVWLGNDDFKPTRGSSSSAAATWRLFMKEVTADMPVESFPRRPKLTGRKGSIEKEPVKPRRSKYFVTKTKSESSNSNSRRSTRRRTTSNSRRSTSRRSASAPRRSSSRNRAAAAPRRRNSAPRRSYAAPRRQAAPAPRRRPAPAPRRQVAPAPAPAPASTAVIKKSKSTPK